jgi:hypothetical protein
MIKSIGRSTQESKCKRPSDPAVPPPLIDRLIDRAKGRNVYFEGRKRWISNADVESVLEGLEPWKVV